MKNVFLLLGVMLLMPVVAAAQTTDPGWPSVKEHLGKRVQITTIDGKSTSGTLTAADEHGATLQSGGKSVSFDLQQVQRVHLIEKTSRMKSTLIGLGVGAGAGAVLGAAAAAPCDHPCFFEISRPQGAAIMAVPGAVIGAGAGALLGGRTHKKLIYDRAATAPGK